MLSYALTTFSPSDFALAPLVPADIVDVIPDWLRRRLDATGPLPTGTDRLGPATPAEEAVIEALDALLPEVLGDAG
jgi:hypothetical protein